ncbi:NPC2 [Mytilus coruscus]|uniref:NPC2 n=1 Tax=Mytilus coruscus TaxID=42192 RepID=A0A6J8AY09_MYTCO|nr:NPC2 [Mytilus coruscus]
MNDFYPRPSVLSLDTLKFGEELQPYSTSGHIESGKLNSADIQCHSVMLDQGTGKQSCQLLRNSSASISVTFICNVNTTQVKSVVHGMIPGIPNIFLHLLSHDNEKGIRFLGVKEDACLNNNVDHCNIKAGDTVQYTNTLPVDEDYPKLRLTVRWEIRDDKNRDLVCILLPTEII